MSTRDELIRKYEEEINRCKLGKLDSRHEYDMGRLSLAELNNRLAEYDKRIEEAQAELRALQGERAPPTSETAPAEAGAAHWDVFISYARESKVEAHEVYERLTSAGFKVWMDTENIRHTEQWPMAVQQALSATDWLVLLLTPEAMTSKQVFSEWFYFYDNDKPIHCLLVKTCEIHYQLLPYQYLDWREPRQRDWDRLLSELREPFHAPEAITPSPIVNKPGAEDTDAPSPFADLLLAARDPDGKIALSDAQIKALATHKPRDLAEYWLGRIAEWSDPRYALDRRFVQLTLLLDKGEDEPQRWQPEDYRFNDLRDVLAKVDAPALVVLGVPGSGKSTLLRRLQMDHSLDQLRQNGQAISFFAQLNIYDGKLQPREWLNVRWQEQFPDLPSLDTYLKAGRVLLLLDALNEMPHSTAADYHERVGKWRTFIQEIAQQGNRAIFSCRSLDYSASLSSKELRVPQLEVQRMSAEQVRRFIELYAPGQADAIWAQLEDSPQLDLYRTPLYLKLLLDQVRDDQHVPKGKAELFTRFVRQMLAREIEGGNPLLLPDDLLKERDHAKLAQQQWTSPFELPERGLLIPALSRLAFQMQQDQRLHIDHDDACKLLDHPRAEDILKAGGDLTLLDENLAREDIAFFHQLLQEYFAARQLAQHPDPTLVHSAWTVEDVDPPLEQVLAMLPFGDPLPPLPQTSWEETTLTAAPMARDPNDFIRALLPHNLPLAARCAASPEIAIDPDLKRHIQDVLIARTQDRQADLRARIAAGLALGEIGDPRFERRTGPYGDYLLPPLIPVEGGIHDRQRGLRS